MTDLQVGKYQTRSSRVVELIGQPETKENIRPGGEKHPVRVWKGHLLKADAKTIDSTYEWEETLLPGTIASFVTAGRTEGISHEHDLVQRLG